MTVAVCTKNKNLMKLVKEKDGREVFFINDIEDVETKQFDLTIVDIDMCSERLDVARLQSSRTVFIKLDPTEESIENIIDNFNVDYFPFKYYFSGKQHTIELPDIAYFESRHREIRAYFENNQYVRFYGKLDDVQKRVDNYVQFLRVNKSCLVNYIHCDIKNYEVRVLDRQILVSRTYREEFKKRLKIIKNM